MVAVVERGLGTDPTANAYLGRMPVAAGDPSDANPAVTLGANDYHTARGNTDWTDLAAVAAGGGEAGNAAIARLDAALVKATDYIDTHNIKGSRLNDDQPLEFPRKDLGVPLQVREACAEYALDVIKGNDLQPDIVFSSQKVQSSKRRVGPIEREDRFLTSGRTSTKALFPRGDNLLRRYIFRPNRTYR